MEFSLLWAPGSKVDVAVDGTLLWTNGPWSLAAPHSLQVPFSMCIKHKLALICHLNFDLQADARIHVAEAQLFPSFSVPTGLEYPSIERSGDPTGARSCKPVQVISVCAILHFSFCLQAGPCRTPQAGGGGCGTPTQCQEVSLQSGCPSSPCGFGLMQPSSLPWRNGAGVFLWSVKQLLDLSAGVSHLRAG